VQHWKEKYEKEVHYKAKANFIQKFCYWFTGIGIVVGGLWLFLKFQTWFT
jgi:hypothetical protein